MPVATLDEIHRYPIKSMLGERVQEIAIREDGLLGDRSWAIRDEQRGSIEGGRKLPALLNCAAQLSGSVQADASAADLPVPTFELPDGTKLRADDPEAARQLSALSGRPLTLWARQPATDEAHHRRGAPDHPEMLDELRAIFARLPEEPLPDLGALPREVLVSSTLPGTYFDCYPIFLLSRSSLASLSAAQPDSIFDVRRFRPNLLVDCDDEAGFPENAWVGRRVRIGEVVLRIAVECPRCVMTTHPIAELPKDPQIMRTLVKENGGNLGVYASVETPGTLREGDAFELLEG